MKRAWFCHGHGLSYLCNCFAHNVSPHHAAPPTLYLSNDGGVERVQLIERFTNERASWCGVLCAVGPHGILF